MPLIQFNVYFRDYLCMLMLMVHTSDSRENRLFQEAHPAIRRIASLIWVQWGRSRSLKMALFDRSYALYDFLLAGHCIVLSCTIFQLFDVIWRWVISWPWNQVRDHSRSLKLVPFESLSTVFHSHFIATVTIYLAVCEIFRQRQRMACPWKMGGCSRSLKVAPFDRPHTTFYGSAIVSIALFCTIFELFGVE